MAQRTTQKEKPIDISKYNVVHPTAISQAISGRQAPSLITGKKNDKNGQTWEMLQEISDEIGKMIANMALMINESVEMVNIVGCEHINEFNVLVKKTNEDLIKFAEDFAKVKAQHEGRTGRTKDANETALCFSIFENYMQFRAHFEGTMHHTQIAFTEYALEARDRAEDIIKEAEKQKAQTAEEPAKAAE